MIDRSAVCSMDCAFFFFFSKIPIAQLMKCLSKKKKKKSLKNISQSLVFIQEVSNLRSIINVWMSVISCRDLDRIWIGMSIGSAKVHVPVVRMQGLLDVLWSGCVRHKTH